MRIISGIVFNFIIANCLIAQPLNPSHVLSISNGAFGTGPVLQEVSSMAMYGKIAFVASGSTNSIEIIDTSNPNHLEVKGRILRDSGEFLVSNVSKLKIVDSILFVLSEGDEAFEIINIIDPLNPKRIGRFITEEYGVSWDFDIYGNMVYIFIKDGILILDVEDASDPKFVRFTKLNVSYQGGHVQVYNETLYVESAELLVIYSLANPESPHFLSSIYLVGTDWTVTSLVVKDNYAYFTFVYSWIGFGFDGLGIIDIANPNEPDYVNYLFEGADGATLDKPRAIVIKDNYAYVGGSENNLLEVIDITDPLNLVPVAKLTSVGSPADFRFDGTILLVASRGGFATVSVENPVAPMLLGNLNHKADGIYLNELLGIEVNDTVLYVVCGWHPEYRIPRIQSLSIGNPTRPKQVFTHFLEEGWAPSLSFKGNYLYIAQHASLMTYDNSIKGVFQFVNKIDQVVSQSDFNNSHGGFFEVRGNYGFWIGNYGNELNVVDLSIPDKPRITRDLNLDIYGLFKAELSGNYLFILSKMKLTIISIADPKIPRILSTVTFESSDDSVFYGYYNHYSLAHVNDFVYLAINNDLIGVDITNPSSPEIVELGYEIKGIASNMYAYFGYIFVLSDNTIEILDTADPKNPILAAKMENGKERMSLQLPLGMAFKENYAYVINRTSIEVINLNFPLITSTEFQPLKSAIPKVHPNPSQKYVNINLKELEQTFHLLEIVNLEGQIIETIELEDKHELVIDVSGYITGLYFLRFSGEYTFTYRLFKD